MKGEYLSNIVDVGGLEEEKLNLIHAPCGCGKTTFAKTVLKNVQDYYNDYYYQSMYKRDMLYLIDTAMGKEQLLHSKGAEEMENFWTGEPYWKLPGITVMTYSGYQTLCEKAPQYNDWKENSVIVCDELQNEILWSKWEKESDLHTKALGRIAYNVVMTNNLVVALSATPKWIKQEFDFCLYEVPLSGIPRTYENESVIKYNNLQLLLDKLHKGLCGILYVSQIDEMKKYEAYFLERGFNCAAIWSNNRKDKPMSEKQKKVREYIIQHRELPSDVDVLIINSACATSITIGEGEKTKKPIDFMIVHSADVDLQTQVRGRYRHDLKRLYLHEIEQEDEIVVPAKWLFQKLTKKDRDKLCADLGFKDGKGRLLKWPSIKKKLLYNGYIISEERTSKERYVIIEEL